jgi:hypothetical protein
MNLQRMPLVVIEHKPLGPVDVGLLGAVGIVLEPNRMPSASSGQARTWSSSLLSVGSIVSLRICLLVNSALS